VICVLPLFHIFALTVVLLSSLRRGNLISLHQRFDVEAVMRDIEVKRPPRFGRSHHVDRDLRSLPDLESRDLVRRWLVCGSGGGRRCRSRSPGSSTQGQYEA